MDNLEGHTADPPSVDILKACVGVFGILGK